jgi:hypothetical protein
VLKGLFQLTYSWLKQPSLFVLFSSSDRLSGWFPQDLGDNEKMVQNYAKVFIENVKLNPIRIITCRSFLINRLLKTLNIKRKNYEKILSNICCRVDNDH